MVRQFLFGTLLLCISVAFPIGADDTDSPEVIEAFEKKVCLNPIAIETDPYNDPAFNWTPPPEASVCAIQYELDNTHYTLQTFANKEDALDAGFIVTHQGQCGTCSTLQDLATYLYHEDLTTPVRKCSTKLVFPRWAKSCLRDLGFSDECAQTWLYNMQNTRRECFWVCVSSWLNNEPFNKEDGSLNDCLACDEEKSGPVFKAASGRTRRNSGIRSAIERDDEEIYPIVHDYY